MSSARVLRGLLLGAIGGFLAWMIVEPIPYLTTDPVPGAPVQEVDITAIAILGAILGGCIGLAMGVSEGIAGGTRSKFQRAVGLGALVGIAGGLIGLYSGQALYGALETNPYGPPRDLFEFFRRIMTRSLGWGLIGVGVGFSVGVPTQSSRKMRHGLVGGTIGGLLGGFSFQTLSMSGMFTGEILRMIGFTTIGASVGFFVSLVDEALKQAWVRVLVGRNEGKEHILDRAVNVLGRDELAEVPLFGDVSVARQHALIERVGSRHVLRDAGTPAGTLVNGQRVAEATLRDGDRIQVGSHTIVFYEKATASRLRRPVDVARPPAVSPPPVPGNVCPFCGTAKDPLTGACACTVAEAPAAVSGAGGPPGADASVRWENPFAPPAGATVAKPAPEAAGGGTRLVVLSGPSAGQSFSLLDGPAAIGRDPTAQISFPSDPTVSRRHATIIWDGAAWVLRDEGSTNGTFVNGARVSEQALRLGDQIRVGANELRLT
jgi:pSer/pThr/pTyr-binding forkhead associated (FHA) protein